MSEFFSFCIRGIPVKKPPLYKKPPLVRPRFWTNSAGGRKFLRILLCFKKPPSLSQILNYGGFPNCNTPDVGMDEFLNDGTALIRRSECHCNSATNPLFSFSQRSLFFIKPFAIVRNSTAMGSKLNPKLFLKPQRFINILKPSLGKMCFRFCWDFGGRLTAHRGATDAEWSVQKHIEGRN